MTGKPEPVAETAEDCALEWETDETRTEWGIQLSDEDEVQEYGTSDSSEKAARRDIARVPIWSEGARSAALMSRVVQHRTTAWTEAGGTS